MTKSEIKSFSPIFLNDPTILPWEKPLPKETISMLGHYDGLTNLAGFLGQESLDTSIGNYQVHASAAKYAADIARLSENMFRAEERLTGPIVREILFEGGIQIYQEGVIPGTQIGGQYLLTSGKVWAAVPRMISLKELILDDGGLKAKIERIEQIAQGYKMQGQQEREAKRRRVNETYRRGG